MKARIRISDTNMNLMRTVTFYYKMTVNKNKAPCVSILKTKQKIRQSLFRCSSRMDWLGFHIIQIHRCRWKSSPNKKGTQYIYIYRNMQANFIKLSFRYELKKLHQLQGWNNGMWRSIWRHVWLTRPKSNYCFPCRDLLLGLWDSVWQSPKWRKWRTGRDEKDP